MPKPIIQENFFETKKKDSKLYVSYMLNALVAQLRPTLCDPMDPLAHQAPLSMGFPRQEYWRGLSFPCPEDLPSHITYLRGQNQNDHPRLSNNITGL